MEHIINQIGSKSSPVIVELKEYEGRKLFDIRKYFKDKKTDELLPTKKGISLNPFQLKQLIETINTKSKEINNFLFSENTEKIEITTEIRFESLIGRKFKYEFENGKSTLVLDKKRFEKLEINELEVMKKLLISINSAIYDVLDDQDQVELILDIIDHKLDKIKW